MSHLYPSTLKILNLMCILCMLSEWCVVEGKMATSQSSTYRFGRKYYPSHFGSDRNVNTFSCTRSQTNPYWQIDLGNNYLVSGVAIINRVDCCGERLHNLAITVDRHRCAHYKGPGKTGRLYPLNCIRPVVGRKIKLAMKGRGFLTLSEVYVDMDRALPHVKEHSAVGSGKPEWIDLRNKKTRQSTTIPSDNGMFASKMAIDRHPFTFSSTIYQKFPYWILDLGKNYLVQTVTVLNRKDCCGKRLYNLEVFIDKKICAFYRGPSKTKGVVNLNCRKNAIGHTVTLKISGKSFLSLAEVKVRGTEVKKIPDSKDLIVTKHKRTHQSSTYSNRREVYTSSFANDGNKNTFSHTKLQHNPYWWVDLGKKYSVTGVVIGQRMTCCGYRLKRLRIFVDNQRCSYFKGPGRTGKQIVLNCGHPLVGRRVTLKMETNGVLELAEVLVRGTEVEKTKQSQVEKTKQSQVEKTRQSQGHVEWINANSKNTFQSSTHHRGSKRYTANLAADRNVKTFSCTKFQNQPYWWIDLGEKYLVKAVLITNRIINSVENLRNFGVYVDDARCTHNYRGPLRTGQLKIITCHKPLVGRKVVIKLFRKGYLALAEVLVKGEKVTKPSAARKHKRIQDMVEKIIEEQHESHGDDGDSEQHAHPHRDPKQHTHPHPHRDPKQHVHHHRDPKQHVHHHRDQKQHVHPHRDPKQHAQHEDDSEKHSQDDDSEEDSHLEVSEGHSHHIDSEANSDHGDDSEENSDHGDDLEANSDHGDDSEANSDHGDDSEDDDDHQFMF